MKSTNTLISILMILVGICYLLLNLYLGDEFKKTRTQLVLLEENVDYIRAHMIQRVDILGEE